MNAHRPWLSAVLFAGLSLGTAGAGGNDFDPQQAGQRIFEAVSAGNYLQALRFSELFERASRGHADVYGFAMQTLGQIQAMNGLTGEATRTFDQAEPAEPASLSPDALARLNAAEVLDAIPAIVQAARNHHIVILNEAHHQPQGRAFAQQLALALRAQGFTYFAAETFAPGVEGSTRAGYPTLSSGYYSAEPQFGNLVRAALKVGYRLVPYESTSPAPPDPDAAINHREAEQARNLVDRIFKRDPQAKVFIYVGYSHARETPQGSGKGENRWMALRLKTLTGQDPLTIDQTTGVAHSALKFEDPAYRRLDSQGRLNTPKVLRQLNGTFFVTGEYRGAVDMQVFHPRPNMSAGRPDWLALSGARRAAQVQLPPHRDRRLLQAFVSDEPDNAVPVDQSVVPAGMARVSLWLPPGRYRLVLQDEQGRRSALGRLTQP